MKELKLLRIITWAFLLNNYHYNHKTRCYTIYTNSGWIEINLGKDLPKTGKPESSKHRTSALAGGYSMEKK